ncbi:MAG: hypothetical protein II368_01990, partial [Clostridia bacterium]|nr:hypothetical protein [Clostridia bacterium]
MKKLFLTISTLTFIFIAFTLLSCGETTCDHEFGEWETVVEASCSKKGQEKRTCSYGHTETRSIAKEPHAFYTGETIKGAASGVAGKEKVYCECGYSTTRRSSVNLEYKFLSTNGTYAVVGIGECKDANIVIPSTYNGKPVTEIGQRAFRKCDSIHSIVIPYSIGANPAFLKSVML